MKRTSNQTYIDLGGDGTTHTLSPVDPNQLPGQTTFNLDDTSSIFAIIGDGTTYTL